MAEDKNLDNELENIENSTDDLTSSVDNIANELSNETEIQTTQQFNKEEFDSNIETNPQDMITVRPIKFQEFEMTEPNRAIKRNLDIMQDISMHISVELGRAKSTIRDVMDLEEGSIVELDKIAGEQVEVFVNNKLVAKGEVIVIEDKFGVRVTSTNLPKTFDD